MASDGVLMVVVEIVTGSAVVVVVVAMVGAETGDDTRIQHRTPRLSARAPSTPEDDVIPGLVMNCRERRLSTPYPYSSPSTGMKRSNPESGVVAVSVAALMIFWLWSCTFCL